MKASRSDGLIAKYFVMINSFKLNKNNAFVCIFGEASNVPLNCCMTLVKLGNQIHALEDGRRNSLRDQSNYIATTVTRDDWTKDTGRFEMLMISSELHWKDG
jgi:hypothetical protein